MDTPKGTGIGLVKTIGACFLAPVATSAVAVAVGFLLSLFYNLTIFIRPEIIGFIAAIVGGVAGMFAARSICDKWLEGYQPQAVFVVYAALLAGLVYMYLFFYPFEWTRLSAYGQLLVIAFYSYTLFWKVKSIE